MTLLGGRYETLKPIASGGMATVHLGRAVGVGGFERLVAIKVMHDHIADEPEFVTMFLDEARLAARIRHPNVVPTLDVQETADGLFLVMEFIDGPSLKLVRRQLSKAPVCPPCRSGGRLPVDVAIRIMVDVLGGLEAAHELADDDGEPLNLIHRDVTPANILVGADGQTRLTDFGVARAETRLSSTRGGQVKGKVPYMPPEQLLGESLDRRCDVYAAGVVLWETLVGRRLFKADNEGALLQQIISGAATTPRQEDPEIPAALDAVTMKAIAKNPADRYPTAGAFAEALEAAARDAGMAIASSRVVAAFLAETGVHRALSAKELGALKAGAVPSSRAVMLSQNEASEPSAPAGPPVSRSGVTATEAALSTRPAQASSSYKGLIGGVVIALAGLATGLFVATSSKSSGDAGPAAGDVSAVVAEQEDQPTEVASSDSAPEEPSGSPETEQSPEESAAPPPSSTPTTAPSSNARVSPPKPQPVKPTAPPAVPRPVPKPNTFNPDRL